MSEIRIINNACVKCECKYSEVPARVGFAHDDYQLPENLLLPSEGIFVTQRLAPPAPGYKCAANTHAERKHEKLIKESYILLLWN